MRGHGGPGGLLETVRREVHPTPPGHRTWRRRRAAASAWRERGGDAVGGRRTPQRRPGRRARRRSGSAVAATARSRTACPSSVSSHGTASRSTPGSWQSRGRPWHSARGVLTSGTGTLDPRLPALATSCDPRDGVPPSRLKRPEAPSEARHHWPATAQTTSESGGRHRVGQHQAPRGPHRRQAARRGADHGVRPGHPGHREGEAPGGRGPRGRSGSHRRERQPRPAGRRGGRQGHLQQVRRHRGQVRRRRVPHPLARATSSPSSPDSPRTAPCVPAPLRSRRASLGHTTRHRHH